jgi:hypothetical protein
MTDASTAGELPQRKLCAFRLTKDFECRAQDGAAQVTVVVGRCRTAGFTLVIFLLQKVSCQYLHGHAFLTELMLTSPLMRHQRNSAMLLGSKVLRTKTIEF